MFWQRPFLLLLFCSFGFASLIPVLLRRACNDSPTCFWADFPTCSEQCHVTNWPSSSCYAAGSLSDACLCPNVAWQTINAQCIGQYCNSELQESAAIYSTNCANNGDPLGISEADFVSIGEAAASSVASTSTTVPTSSATPTTSPITSVPSSISSATPTTSSTASSAPSSTSSAPTSSSSSSSGGGGIDPGTRINIILGTVIPGVTLLLAGFGIYLAHRDSKAKKEKKKKQQQNGHELQDLHSPSVIS